MLPLQNQFQCNILPTTSDQHRGIRSVIVQSTGRMGNKRRFLKSLMQGCISSQKPVGIYETHKSWGFTKLPKQFTNHHLKRQI